MVEQPRPGLRIAVAQLNPVVGDFAGNLALAREARASAAAAAADLIVLTELFVCGYPPEDLVLRPAFIAACAEAVSTLASDTSDGGPAILVGAPTAAEGGVHNSVLLLDGGRVAAVRHKRVLPNDGVFDEKRVFIPGPPQKPVDFRGVCLGLPICEDLWAADAPEAAARSGAEVVIVVNGSPWWRGKDLERRKVAGRVARGANVPVIYANMVGGQDELVFDGGSFGLDADGSVGFRLPGFATGLATVGIAQRDGAWRLEPSDVAPVMTGEEADWRASVLGLRDYVEKNRFPGVVFGLSGGIDSAVVAAMAVDALGPGRVRALMLPYRFTAAQSLEDAAACARALGVRYDVAPIGAAVAGLDEALRPLFAGTPPGVAEENLQARARGVMLMAVSNKFGPLLLTTGNKSELATGYATLYGDMAGGFNSLKDLYKTEVYRLAHWRNASSGAGLLGPAGPVIPAAIIRRPPTAELMENQTDQDTLPPYPVLDAILFDLIERQLSAAAIIESGQDADTVRRVAALVAAAEHKRRQAAPGVKLGPRAFGRDRRYPITNRFAGG